MKIAPFLLLPLAGALTAQSPEGQPAFQVDVKLVSVPFSVRDTSGGLLGDLRQEDFRIFEEGREQSIFRFSRQQDLPLTIGLLLDMSGSQTHLAQKNSAAAVAFLRRVLRPSDRAFVVTFSGRVRLLCDLTSSVDQLAAALDNVAIAHRSAPTFGPNERRRGGTAFYDAMVHAAMERLKSIDGRKALLVISDGEDQGSLRGVNDAIEAMQTAGAVFYAIKRNSANYKRRAALLMPLAAPSLLALRSRMDKIAAATGGREFEPKSEVFDAEFKQIEEELRTLYEIVYRPDASGAAGEFRKIRIQPVRKGLVVRARPGYFVR